MPTSGQFETVVFDLAKILSHAYRRCKLTPALISAEMAGAGRDLMSLLTSEWVTRNLLLWSVEMSVIGLRAGQTRYTLPPGTLDVINVLMRRNTRVSDGAGLSSAAGIVNNAFDDDLNTILTQTAINGNVSYTRADRFTVYSVGVVSYGAATYKLAFEWSDDGITWSSLNTSASVAHADLVPVWHTIAIPTSAYQFRVRETGGATLNLRELVLAVDHNETPVFHSSLDNYVNLPNKLRADRQITQVYVDRRVTGPELVVWPAYDGYLDNLVVWRKRHIQDPGDFVDANGDPMQLEIPQRWHEAIIAGMAFKIAAEHPDVKADRETLLSERYEAALELVSREERDGTPVIFAPDIGGYTR